MTITGGLTMALAAIPTGSKVVFSGLARNPRSSGSLLQERMGAMGFVPGVELTVEANHGRGPVIVQIRGARVAIGRGQAQQVMVRPVIDGSRTERQLGKAITVAGAIGHDQ